MTLVASVGVGEAWWWLAPDSAVAVPTQLTAAERADASERILLIARDVQGAFLVTSQSQGQSAQQTQAQTPTVVVPGSSPEEAATALAARAGLTGHAVTAVAAWARETEELRAEMTPKPGLGVVSSTVQIDSLSATRSLHGVVQVCANVHSEYQRADGPVSGDVIPWVVTEDPATGKITDLEVQDWDGGDYTC
ncbi:hypothetical protein [Quadrisphaera granulorum]|uniref:hypothetical protein n=1 Tax=Quadrisphaera granulorum TaxID=317664 RepID=UPI000D6C1B4F|nr:hypothetical protein [Quadrisphaera granulorum]